MLKVHVVKTCCLKLLSNDSVIIIQTKPLGDGQAAAGLRSETSFFRLQYLSDCLSPYIFSFDCFLLCFDKC